MKAEAAFGAEVEVRAVVRHGRALLGQAVRASWARNLLSRENDDTYGLLGSAAIEALILRTETDDVLEPASEATAPPAPSFDPALARLGELVEKLGEGEAALHIMVLTLAIEVDAVARTFAAYLRGSLNGATPTVGMVIQTLGEARTAEVVAALAAGAPLRRHYLIETLERSGELMSSATTRAMPRLVRWLLDPTRIDEEVGAFAVLIPPGGGRSIGAAALATVEESVEEVRRLLWAQRHSGGPQRDVVLRGPRGAGRSEIAREACRRLDLPVLCANVGALLAQPNPTEAAAALLREALLAGAQVLLEGGEALTAPDDSAKRLRLALGVSTFPLVIVTSSPAGETARISPQRGMVLREVTIAATHEREAVWGEILPEAPAVEIASLYRVGIGAMARVADGARLRAEVRGLDGGAGTREVAEALRSEFETDLGTVATRVDVSQRWTDLVVPDETGRTIAELVDQLRHRSTVLGRWGFSRKLGKGLGTTALFSGEPGTGKSMVAGLIARELGLELYQIDLSRVLSKWIGETEKNLAKVFDAAETGHVVLLFDEADALMGKRTADVKSSNDRYANLETNYILQRLEAFHGVAILTSNLESSIDPALSRRLSFELAFPFPDEAQRAQLWQRMLPDELPVVGEIDYPLLAERFELAGGHIRNIVLRAAYLAAAEADREHTDGGLTMTHLLRAAEYEYHDHGMLVAKGRLKR